MAPEGDPQGPHTGSAAGADAPSVRGPVHRKGSRERLPRRARIRRGAEIVALLRKGKRLRRGPLEIFHAPGAESLPRFGVIVPRHRHEIVERNRLRRRLREVGRRDVLPALRGAGLGVDVLVRARPEAYAVGFDELRQILVRFTEELCSGASQSA